MRAFLPFQRSGWWVQTIKKKKLWMVSYIPFIDYSFRDTIIGSHWIICKCTARNFYWFLSSYPYHTQRSFLGVKKRKCSTPLQHYQNLPDLRRHLDTRVRIYLLPWTNNNNIDKDRNIYESKSVVVVGWPRFICLTLSLLAG